MTRGHGTLGSPKSGLFQLGRFGHFYERRSSGVIRASFTAFQSPQRTSTSSPSKMLDAGEALELEAAWVQTIACLEAANALMYAQR